LQNRHAAEVAYQKRLLDACIGKAEFPRVQTTGKTETATSTVFHDHHAATAGQMYDL